MSSGLVPDTGEMRAAIFAALLSECVDAETVRVLFDASAPGVVAPEPLKKGGLWFEYGLNLPRPIPDLVIDARGISATLSFGSTWAATFVPWETVKFVQAPTDVKKRALTKLANGAVDAMNLPSPAPAPRLRVVANDEAAPEGDDAPAPTGWTPRVVKGDAA